MFNDISGRKDEAALQLLDKIVDMLAPFHQLVNTCMVSFIVDDLFTLLDHILQTELLDLTEHDLIKLPAFSFRDEENNIPKDSRLSGILRRIRSLSLESVCHEPKFSTSAQGELDLLHFDKIMPEKKTHEVAVMARFVHSLYVESGVMSVVDLGSGKAYLSHTLSNLYSVPVMAIDSNEGNTAGAKDRSKLLGKQWGALEKRALKRSVKKDDADLTGLQEDEARPVGQLTYRTMFVNEDVDLQHVLNEPENHQFGIVGLHTCGNLASTSLKVFSKSPHANFICNVGCCYHLIRERYIKEKSWSVEQDTNVGFPISRHLDQKHYYLGRNARMLAAQPLGRMAHENREPSISLLWRAILQVILVKQVPDIAMEDHRVGKIAPKCASFREYVRKAEKKLNRDLDISDNDIDTVYESYSESHRKKLICFYQFRACFASLVESIILLDRLAYLNEDQTVDSVHLVKLFDSKISPRCYGLVAQRP